MSYLDLFATVIFIWAWWHQHCTSKILANLRKDKTG
nr:unnamed protein product [Callosobruchus analis]